MEPPRTSNPRDRLLTIGDVAKLFDVHERTIRRWVACGRFPEPLRPSRRCVRWRMRDIEVVFAQHNRKSSK